MKQISKRELIFLIMMLCLAVGIRVGISLYWNRTAFGLTDADFVAREAYDGRVFIEMAVYVLENGDIWLYNITTTNPVMKAPGYPWLLSIWFSIFGINFLVFLLNPLLGGILVFEIFYLSRLFFSNALFSWLSLIVATFWPALVIEATLGLSSENLYLTLLLLAMILTKRLVDHKEPLSTTKMIVRFSAIGFIAICAIYARPIGILWLIDLTFGVSLLANTPRKLLHRLLIFSTINLVLFALLLSPWFYRSYLITQGRFIFVTDNSITFEQNNDTYLDWTLFDRRYFGRGGLSQDINQAVQADVSRCIKNLKLQNLASEDWNGRYICMKQMVKQFVLTHPFTYLKLGFMRLIKFFLPTPLWTPASGLSTPYALALAGWWFIVYPAGMVFLWRTKRDINLIPFFHLPILLEILLAFFVGTQLRYRLPVDSLLLVAFPVTLIPFLVRIVKFFPIKVGSVR